MSIQAMAFALEQQEIKDATARHVLLCLANYADKEGRGAFPSSASLSQDTGLSLRTIRYKLDYLLEVGMIRLGKQAIAAAYIDRHDRRPVVYDIAMERGANGDNEQVTGCKSLQDGVQITTERGAGAAPNTSYNHQVNQEANAPSAPKRPKVTFEDGEFIVHDCDLLDAWHASYGKPHVEHEIAKAKAWVIAGGKKKKDWARFLTNWLANSSAPLDEGDCPVDKVIDLYHQECPSLPAVTVRSDRTLRGMIVDRWMESPEHQNSKLWQKIFSRAKRRNEVFYRGHRCVPRLEAIVSRAVFRELEEMTV